MKHEIVLNRLNKQITPLLGEGDFSSMVWAIVKDPDASISVSFSPPLKLEEVDAWSNVLDMCQQGSNLILLEYSLRGNYLMLAEDFVGALRGFFRLIPSEPSFFVPPFDVKIDLINKGLSYRTFPVYLGNTEWNITHEELMKYNDSYADHFLSEMPRSLVVNRIIPEIVFDTIAQNHVKPNIEKFHNLLHINHWAFGPG